MIPNEIWLFSPNVLYNIEHFFDFWPTIKCDFDPKRCRKCSSPKLPQWSSLFFKRAYHIEHFFYFFDNNYYFNPKRSPPHPKVNVFFSKRSYNNWLWSQHSSLWKSIFTLKTRQCNQALFDFFWGIIKCESNSSQDAPIKTGRFSSFLPIIKLDFDPRKCHKVDFFLKTYLEKRAFFRLFW